MKHARMMMHTCVCMHGCVRGLELSSLTREGPRFQPSGSPMQLQARPASKPHGIYREVTTAAGDPLSLTVNNQLKLHRARYNKWKHKE